MLPATVGSKAAASAGQCCEIDDGKLARRVAHGAGDAHDPTVCWAFQGPEQCAGGINRDRGAEGQHSVALIGANVGVAAQRGKARAVRPCGCDVGDELEVSAEIDRCSGAQWAGDVEIETGIYDQEEPAGGVLLRRDLRPYASLASRW